MARKPPKWVEGLFPKLLKCIHVAPPARPLFTYELLWPLPGKRPAWRMTIRPTTIENVGGPDDGTLYSPNFSVNINELSRAIDAPQIRWFTLSAYRSVGGEGLQITGRYDGRPIVIRICSFARLGSPARQKYHVYSKEMKTIDP